MPAHTPGPWAVTDYPYDVYTTVQQHGRFSIRNGTICRVGGMGNDDRAQSEANARVLALAPELLAVLKRTMEWLDYLEGELASGDRDNFLEVRTLARDAEAVIAKADAVEEKA